MGTKQSPLYLDRAINAGHKEVIFVEGVFYALLLQALGDTRVISGVAASFSNEQIQALKRNHIEKVYHLGDPDGGGIGGTNSNLTRLTLEGMSVYVPPMLPDGLDPDEVANRDGIEALRALIKRSEHGFKWKAKQILAQYGTDSDEKIEKVLKAAAAYAKVLPDYLKLEIESFFWKTIKDSLSLLDFEMKVDKIEANNVAVVDSSDDEYLDIPQWSSSEIALFLANWTLDKSEN